MVGRRPHFWNVQIHPDLHVHPRPLRRLVVPILPFRARNCTVFRWAVGPEYWAVKMKRAGNALQVRRTPDRMGVPLDPCPLCPRGLQKNTRVWLFKPFRNSWLHSTHARNRLIFFISPLRFGPRRRLLSQTSLAGHVGVPRGKLGRLRGAPATVRRADYST